MDLRAINRNRFDVAKRLWGISILIRFLLFFIGAFSVLSKNTFTYTPIVILCLGVIAEILQWRSDIVKGQSESLLRKLDLLETFHNEISEADKREIALVIPQKARDQLHAALPDSYFAHKESDTPRTAVKNLIESAWYTRQQCADLVKICICLIVLLFFISIITLVISAREITDTTTQSNIGNVVTSWLLLIFSLGIFRNAWGYYKMHQYCLRVEDIGEYILSNPIVSKADARKQWHEYQLNRSSAPILPGWLWAIRKSSLDRAWKSAALE